VFCVRTRLRVRARVRLSSPRSPGNRGPRSGRPTPRGRPRRWRPPRSTAARAVRRTPRRRSAGHGHRAGRSGTWLCVDRPLSRRRASVRAVAVTRRVAPTRLIRMAWLSMVGGGSPTATVRSRTLPPTVRSPPGVEPSELLRYGNGRDLGTRPPSSSSTRHVRVHCVPYQSSTDDTFPSDGTAASSAFAASVLPRDGRPTTRGQPIPRPSRASGLGPGGGPRRRRPENEDGQGIGSLSHRSGGFLVAARAGPGDAGCGP